jgi:prevent-host-death family protein
VNIHDAKTHRSKLLRRVALGEEIVIAKALTPVAKLAPVRARLARRTPGSAKGKLWMAHDFDAPLPEKVLKEFYR